MKCVSDFAALRSLRTGLTGTFGLVPTMGGLHEGHLSLVRRAKLECERVGVSIFVNPAQFNSDEDFRTYPRDRDRDLRLLQPLEIDLVWTPKPESLYPSGFQTWVIVEELSLPLEGKHRPGHFRGVATVVSKLFQAFSPDRAYFGQKDAQQALVIRRLVQDLNYPIEVVVCPTVREADGLAMSSRNARLSQEERAAAGVLFRALSAAKAEYDAGERSADALRAAVVSVLSSEPLASTEYVSAADPDSLDELTRVEERVLLSLAVRIGKTRLIDNFLLPQRN